MDIRQSAGPAANRGHAGRERLSRLLLGPGTDRLLLFAARGRFYSARPLSGKCRRQRQAFFSSSAAADRRGVRIPCPNARRWRESRTVLLGAPRAYILANMRSASPIASTRHGARARISETAGRRARSGSGPIGDQHGHCPLPRLGDPRHRFLAPCLAFGRPEAGRQARQEFLLGARRPPSHFAFDCHPRPPLTLSLV